MARVLLGVTGGIAAYKACELCRLLVKDGHDVVPLVTPGAERFVTEETFRALARAGLRATTSTSTSPAPTCSSSRRAHRQHTRQARTGARRQRSDRGCARAPRAAARRAGDEPADVVASRARRQRRDAARARRRARGPDEGETAEGELGVGRMAEPEEILRAVDDGSRGG